MKHLSRAVAVLALSMLAVPAALAGDTSGPAGGRPVSASDLAAFFSGKTWRWGDTGAAYFSPDGTFLGWSGNGGVRSVAAGQWTVTKGRICFSAKWYVGAKESPGHACFLTVQQDGTIWQRGVDAGGHWYLFKHAQVQPNDEINSLSDGDHVTPQLSALEKERIMR